MTINFTSRSNPSTKCKEILGVVAGSGETVRVAIIPRDLPDAERFTYGSLIQTACQVAVNLHPQLPHVPLATLPELIKVVRREALLYEIRQLLLYDIDEGRRKLHAIEGVDPLNSTLTTMDQLEDDLHEQRKAVLAQLRDVR